MAKKIAIVQGSAIYDYLHYTYPKIILLPTQTELEALKKVSNGMADATICEPVRASYYMEKYNIKHLKVSQDLHYNYNLRIASRSDIPMLNVILSKAVDHISSDIKKTLNLKWGYVKDKEKYFDKQTLIYLAIVFAITLPFAIYLYFINRSLAKEIAKRKNVELEITKLNANLEAQVALEVEKNRQQQLFMLQQNRLAQLGEMISMIAHQWKQPLNNLYLLTQTVIMKYNKSLLDDTMMQYFQKNSKKQINEMSNVINNFMSHLQIKNITNS
ncbi:hypothetical protein [Sulfurimonas sp.]